MPDITDEDEIEAQPVPDDDDLPCLRNDDLDLASPMCKKASKHKEFIPVNQFSMEHLPFGLRDPLFYAWVQSCVPVVVRVVGNGGKATGRTCLLPEDIHKEKLCEDKVCSFRRKFGKRHFLYGGIGIITNKHAITDKRRKKIEVTNAAVEFFYHNHDNRQTIIKEMGTKMRIAPSENMDYATFSCYTHFRNLPKAIEILDQVRDAFWNMIPEHVRDDSKKHAIIISHPHGTSKKISIGLVMDRVQCYGSDSDKDCAKILSDIFKECDSGKDREKALKRFESYYNTLLKQLGMQLPYTKTLYTTATCQGSSGAPVYMGNVVKERGLEVNQAHTHRGCDPVTGHNNCRT